MNTSSRLVNAKRNIIYGVVNKIFAIFVPFITRTILIKTIGAEYLGLDSLFTSVLQILNLSEMGMSSAIVYSMYEPVANNKITEVNKLLNFYKRIYAFIGYFIFFVGICLLPWVKSFIRGNIPSDINVYVVYMVFLINTTISYVLFGYKNSILNANQRVDIISNCASITKGLLALLQILVLYWTKQYYYYVVLIPITTLINNFLVKWYVDKKYYYYKCEGTIDNEFLKSFKKRILGLFASKFCAGIRTSIDSISISAFLGLTITAMYSNYFMIVSALTSICAIFTSSILSGIGNSIVLEKIETNYANMRIFDFFYMWITGIIVVCISFLVTPFMYYWVGEDLMFPQWYAFLFAFYFYALRINDIKGLYQDATGLWWENRYRAIFEVILNIVLNIVLVRFIGVIGVILAAIMSLLVVNFGFGSHIVFKHYFKNGKLVEFYIDHIKYFLATIVCVGINLILCNTENYNYTSIIINLLYCIAIPNVIYFICFYKSIIFHKTMSLIKRIFIKK